jgi:YHS domain-containing protein
MKKVTKCDKCGCVEENRFVCDTCGNYCDIYVIGTDSSIEVIINGVDYNFCNYNCLLEFINREIEKER